jgi:phosphatidylglycerophosphate synthase
MVADDYRDFGTKILDPIAEKIPLNPMGISFLSLITAITAGYSFYIVEEDLANKHFLLIGSGMVFLTAVLDALDGIVARKRNLSSKRGDLVDHTLDRVADILIIGGIAFGAVVDIEIGFAAIIGVLMLSYMGTQAQAVGAGREYAGLLGRADRLIVLMLVPIIHYFNQEQNYMELMCYAFAIVCTLSAIYRFQRIWIELKD